MHAQNANYMSGFGNEFESEAIEGALPRGQNNPQKCAYGLYAEQLSGSAFTMPVLHNKRSWFYRIRPSVLQSPFEPFSQGSLESAPFYEAAVTPNQLRWNPREIGNTDFIDGLTTYCGGGDSFSWSGLGVHVYTISKSMSETKRYFYNADGEMLFVPQQGLIKVRTECGVLEAVPGEILVLPRGMKFAVDVNEPARGYICENYGSPFEIPNKGPIGANGLANTRDFLSPVAAYEDLDGDFELIAKFGGNLWCSALKHSPLDVVAWHGNYAPYKYDLANFNTINTVSFDHPDPSIFTVLTSPSATAGTANVDFVVFPPRWMMAENTFRPPYFHRNIMSEFMGMINGVYDGKEGGGFVPGGASLHNCMSSHGPDGTTFEKASETELKPQYLDQGLAFMFESRFIMAPTKWALETPLLQGDYYKTWQDIKKNFKG